MPFSVAPRSAPSKRTCTCSPWIRNVAESLANAAVNCEVFTIYRTDASTIPAFCTKKRGNELSLPAENPGTTPRHIRLKTSLLLGSALRIGPIGTRVYRLAVAGEILQNLRPFEELHEPT